MGLYALIDMGYHGAKQKQYKRGGSGPFSTFRSLVNV